MQYATLADRLLGQVIDALVAAIPFVVGMLVAMVFENLALILIGVGAVISVVYYLVCDGLEGGQSIGKRMLGMRVVDRDTRAPCTIGQSFVRNIILSALGPIDWVFMFGERRQRLGDRAANTIVIPA